MSKTDAWLPLYVADYLAATTRLTTEQHGAYLLIIMDYWRNGPPPDDDGVLSRVTGLTLSRWKVQRALIQPFFKIVGGFWQHKRIDAEIERAITKQKAKQEAGKLGGRAKAEAIANAKLKATPSPSPSPNTFTGTETPAPKPLRGASPAPPEFETAWQEYPKRSGNNPKADALRAWNARIAEGVTPDAMQAGLQRYAAWCKATDKIGTETVMQAVRFFGKSQPFEQDFQLPKSNGGGAPWWSSNEGIQAKAAELGIEPRKGEGWGDLKARVNAQLEAH